MRIKLHLFMNFRLFTLAYWLNGVNDCLAATNIRQNNVTFAHWIMYRRNIPVSRKMWTWRTKKDVTKEQEEQMMVYSVVFFLIFNDMATFVGYLMANRFLEK